MPFIVFYVRFAVCYPLFAVCYVMRPIDYMHNTIGGTVEVVLLHQTLTTNRKNNSHEKVKLLPRNLHTTYIMCSQLPRNRQFKYVI